MIAYNHFWLDNLYIQEELTIAYQDKYIPNEERTAVIRAYPVKFYTPNIFIRIGLFILTVIIAAFTFGLLTLIFLSNSDEKAFGSLFILIGITMYGVLEYMVKRKHHYRSGVDDALLLLSGSCITGGLNLLFNISSLGNSIIIFIISLYFLLRFADILMSAIAALALLAIVFFAYTKLGSFAKATTPFLVMAVTAIMYFITKKLARVKKFRHYFNCLTIIEITALVCFYLAGNYYVVREASIAMFNLNLRRGESIPLGWLFWVFTFAIPFIYIFRGIQKKDAVLIRVGLILIAAVIFTVRYYYAVFPIETTMTLSGIALIAISYVLIRYLQMPRHGFTYEELSDKTLIDKLNLEALIITETYGDSQVPVNDNLTGGGSGGGGGATSNF